MNDTEPFGQLVVEPRTPRADRRVDVYLVLLATAAASTAIVAALFADVLPPRGIAIAFFGAAPLAATFALPILLARSRSGSDRPVQWFCAGLVVAVAAMVLQVIAFPTVSLTGGPLQTTGESSAALYLTFHVAPALAAVLASVRASARWMVPFTVAGVVLSLSLAVNLVPLPELLTADNRFTPLLIRIEYVIAALVLVAAALWIWRVGRSATGLRAWIGVSLTLCFYDLMFNAIGGARFTAVWWASLGMRDATYLVLAFGALATLLDQLRRSEAYAESELSRREGQLEKTLAVTRQLLSATAELSRAMRLADVVDVVEANSQAALPGHRVVVALTGAEAAEAAEAAERGTTHEQVLLALVRAHPRASASHDAVFLHGREQIVAWSDDIGHPPAEVLSLAVVPILNGDRLVGHLVVWSRTRHPWSPLERSLVSGLADQASLALVRAEAFEDQARAARTLQQSLLPARLPEHPRLALGAVYRPGEAGTGVGGDWYDCIVVSDQVVALVIGDVMGKGLRAAAVMGQVRTAVRAAAAANPSPVAVLNVLDEVGLGLGTDEIVTMTYALLDLDAGTATFGRAGHLPPILIDPSGRGEAFYGGSSTPLGTPDPDRVEETVPLAPGSSIVLFTDGVVEERTEHITEGVDRLLADLARLGPSLHQNPQSSTESLIDGALSEDDVAVLVAAYH